MVPEWWQLTSFQSHANLSTVQSIKDGAKGLAYTIGPGQLAATESASLPTACMAKG